MPLSLGPIHPLSGLTHLCSLRAYLDVDLTLTREQTERMSQQIASCVVSAAMQLRHFFLVEDFVDSLKVPQSPTLPPGSQHSTPCPWGEEGRRAIAGEVPSPGCTP